jgi:hypothetical protein
MATPHADKGDQPLRRARWKRRSLGSSRHGEHGEKLRRRQLDNIGNRGVNILPARGDSIVCSPSGTAACLNAPPRETKRSKRTSLLRICVCTQGRYSQ